MQWLTRVTVNGTVMFEFESSVLIPLTLRTPCRAELLRRPK